ncbi:MAG: HAD-IA family hydrolase [Candidatus Altiarchaeota archaeon]|nr:HAD-IA family hydrolase [Candidatus Altiarchaeota archaeon]
MYGNLDLNALIWDIDGVLVYVGDSYRKAIVETTQYYFTEIVGLELNDYILSIEDTQKFKMAGGFNNDWEITYGTVLCFLTGIISEIGSRGNCVNSLKDLSVLWNESQAGLDLDHVLKRTAPKGGGLANLRSVLVELYGGSEETAEKFWHTGLIKQLFQEMYLGRVLFRKKYGFKPEHVKSKGFIRNEKPLAGSKLLNRLSEKYIMGIASGREHFEIDVVLKMHGFHEFFNEGFIVGSDDFPSGKPDPSQLLQCRKQIEKVRGFIGGANIAYVGDVPDDIIAARRAGFRSIGVTVSVRDDSGKKRLNKKFIDLGADLVVDELAELEEFI